MGFHLTEATCYLTADLFYLEVVLLPYGGVAEVKVAPHGKAPVPSESFLQLLRSKEFAEFSVKLAGLFTQYDIPGDSETRLKLFSSMQWLWKDLQQISQLPSVPKDSDPRVDVMNHGRSGCLIAEKEDFPMTIQFYAPPTDGMKTSDRPFVPFPPKALLFEETAATEPPVQAARVTVGVSDAAHRLQMASLLPQPPQLDPQGHPVFLSSAEAPHETLPACFLLKLQPAVPMTLSFVDKLRHITDIPIPDVDLQWAPLPKLLTGRSNGPGELPDEQDTIFTVPLPDGALHRYVLLAAAWGEAPAQRAAAVDSIPFTHPAHVPALLQLLRHQSAINTLLRSCIGPPGDGAAGKGSSSISSDISSSTDHTPTKAPKNAATTEGLGLDSSTRTLSTPSPGLILPSKSSSLSSNGHDTNSSSSSARAETVAVVHSQPGTHTRSRHSKSHHHAPVDLLPDHALLQIFSHLPTNQLCRCARVCRRWYNLAWDPRLWGTVRLTGELLHADRAIRVLTHRLCQDTPNVCLTLETVVVNGCKRLTDRGLHVVAHCCPELRRLEVAGCYNVSNEAVFEVVSRCPSLEHLNLSGCSKVTCISLTQEASLQLSPLHGQQISIHYLDMTDCFSLEDEGLRTIASHCPRLTHLYLRRCTRLTDEALRHLSVHCPSIRELSLSDCRLVGDFGLREVARLEGCLRYLSVAHCTRITDVGVRYVARYCPRLRYLNARGCEGLTDHGLSHLARSCPRLKSLDVGKCPLVSDGGLEQLAMYCQGLRRVSLRACESVTGRGLKALAANCCELQLLNVQDCEVSPEALRFVRRHCRRCVIEHTNPAFY
nr:F-box/LRR-repeat protein 7-like isoform X6 [Gasterosteus aculeatus aculeatus]